ncbi:MAG TPA: ABC transporter substrate-binding protein [Candidatus Sulfotelmatobacter sp.]|nr:ABC transporter substrate-binding protein [Candidatus Sulfotelmatobacter sp.]
MASNYGVRRIACLQPSATVILDAIGELGQVVACTRYCADVVPAVADGSRTILADSWTANAEQIAAIHPDLVIASVPYQEKAVIEILKSGARFLGLAPKNLEDVYTDIASIAGVVGASGRGDSVILEMKQTIEQVRDRVSGSTRPKVFCEEWGKPVITSQRWVAELVEAAGGAFLGEPGRAIPSADLVPLDPDVIVAAWCSAGDRVPLEKIVAARGWQQTSAARMGRVFCIRDEFLNTPAPTLLRGLHALAFAIHPDLFPKPEGIRQIKTVSSAADLAR